MVPVRAPGDRWLVMAALVLLPRAAAAQPSQLACPDRITTRTGHLSQRDPRTVTISGVTRAQCYGGALSRGPGTLGVRPSSP